MAEERKRNYIFREGQILCGTKKRVMAYAKKEGLTLIEVVDVEDAESWVEARSS